MAHLKILGIAVAFCVVALGAGMIVGRLFSVGALPTSSAATAQPIGQARTQAPAPTGSAGGSATTAPALAPTEPPATPTPEPTPSADAPTPTQAAPSATPALTPTLEVAYIEYTIQKGDILYNLAQKYNVTIEEILAVNDISNPESLTVGQEIRIPKK